MSHACNNRPTLKRTWKSLEHNWKSDTPPAKPVLTSTCVNLRVDRVFIISMMMLMFLQRMIEEDQDFLMHQSMEVVKTIA